MGELDGQARLAAEQRARVVIDRQLVDAGWSVQDKKDLNLFAAEGVACREVVMKSGHGRADYVLYVDKKAVGIIEAKPEGTALSGVEWQSGMYAEGLPVDVRLRALTVAGRLPFVFEASGTETHFTNGYDPEARARRLFSFPKPSTLAKILRDADADPDQPTWRAKVRHLPELDPGALRPVQITAITGIEHSLASQQFDRSLVQMATGSPHPGAQRRFGPGPRPQASHRRGPGAVPFAFVSSRSGHRSVSTIGKCVDGQWVMPRASVVSRPRP